MFIFYFYFCLLTIYLYAICNAPVVTPSSSDHSELILLLLLLFILDFKIVKSFKIKAPPGLVATLREFPQNHILPWGWGYPPTCVSNFLPPNFPLIFCTETLTLSSFLDLSDFSGSSSASPKTGRQRRTRTRWSSRPSGRWLSWRWRDLKRKFKLNV